MDKTNEFKKFIELSRAIGKRVDFIQGAGGNVSVKIDNIIMLIKASGWRLADISENDGLVAVDMNNGNIKNSEILRPSIETGFHIFLGKYVVHTHSVYANIISCAVNGEKLWNEIFKKIGASAVWVDYQSPGHYLALAVKEKTDKFKNQHNAAPEAILMQNHGLIVSGENSDKVFNLHNEIQEAIKRYLNLKLFPANGEGYLKKLIKINKNFIADFSRNILFPDQAVFCGNIDEKISINEKTGDIVYKTNEKEALAIKENLIAWAYIINCAKYCGLTLKFLSSEEVDYIKNMESEKYRQNLIKK